MKPSLIVATALCLCACNPTDDCQINDTRCQGDVAQVCGSDQRWRDVMDCAEVSVFSDGKWTCVVLEDGGGHTCLPTDDGKMSEGAGR